MIYQILIRTTGFPTIYLYTLRWLPPFSRDKYVSYVLAICIFCLKLFSFLRFLKNRIEWFSLCSIDWRSSRGIGDNRTKPVQCIKTDIEIDR